MKKTRNEFLCMQKFPVECLKISILIEKLLHHITHLIVRLSHTHTPLQLMLEMCRSSVLFSFACARPDFIMV